MDHHSLELDVRRRIYNCIVESPGLHFREIQRRTNLATGSIDYHLHQLHKNGLIKMEKDKNYARYYPLTKNWSEDERKILGMLRNTKMRHIIVFLITKKKSTPLKIAEATTISLSTLSWYLKQLQENGIVTHTKSGRFRFYRLTDSKKMAEYMVTYRSSFLDTF